MVSVSPFWSLLGKVPASILAFLENGGVLISQCNLTNNLRVSGNGRRLATIYAPVLIVDNYKYNFKSI